MHKRTSKSTEFCVQINLLIAHRCRWRTMRTIRDRRATRGAGLMLCRRAGAATRLLVAKGARTVVIAKAMSAGWLIDILEVECRLSL